VGAAARLIALALGWMAGTAAAAPVPALFPSGASAYVVEVDGRRIASRAADRELPPASLTKLMTVLLIIESGTALDSVATVSPRAAAATGSHLGLHAGERITIGNLVEAALVASANDACLVLAEQAEGSEARFVARMNRRAAELGLTHTHFVNACGHDDRRHYASAADLARLATLAMEQPAIARAVGLEQVQVRTVADRQWTLSSTNLLLGRYLGADGIKTGYTPAAGRCLIARASRNGMTVLLVVLGAVDRWWESEAALDRAFDLARGGMQSR
jgi:D-alanyl-D-alanine carboxypeptidase (penicillin-binding protein 5/6)